MAKVVIFGIQDFAQLANYYLENDSSHEVVAFCVNRQYLPENRVFQDKPVVAFEDVESIYPPSDFSFFAPMSPQKMNRLREEVYLNIKARGYNLISYISSKATWFNNQIGDNCFILENNTIQPFVKIGDNVVLWSGNHIGHHSILKDHIMFTSQVVLSGHCIVENYCTLGVNSTIRDNIKISEGSFVAMGAVIIKDTDPWSMYKGNPGIKAKRSTKEF